MCTTDNEGLAERLGILRAHGGKPKYHHALIGGNFRLDELQAAVLVVKLKYLDGWTQARQGNARRYDERLGVPGLRQFASTPLTARGCRHIYNQYVLRVRRRDELRERLTERGIGTEIYYPVPLHMQQCFASLRYAPQDCPESVRAAAETVALPIYPELTSQQIDHVARTITEFYQA
jgi:dTDP-4-amino-4,6-dideoxygalactose transaminase